jgi:hypothetical protein
MKDFLQGEREMLTARGSTSAKGFGDRVAPFFSILQCAYRASHPAAHTPDFLMELPPAQTRLHGVRHR